MNLSLHEDLGDAFAKLYDALAAGRPSLTQLEAYPFEPAYRTAWKATQDAIEAIRHDLWISGRPLQAALDSGPAAVHGALGAIDLALSRADRTAPEPDDLVAHRARRRLRRKGGFHLMEGDGAVLLKRGRPTRPALAPETLRETYNLLRVSAATWAGIKHIVVPRAHDHAVLPLDALHFGSLPLAAEAGDLDMTSTQTSLGRHVYRAAPTSALVARVRGAARVLAASKLDLAVMPEFTLDPSILSEWRRSSTDSLPTWILVGTGPVSDPGLTSDLGASAVSGTALDALGVPLEPNRAVLMHGPSGSVIAVQDKQFGFTMLPGYLSSYGLGSAPAVVHDEGMEVGRGLTVVESSAGRLAIFVCEDLGRLPQLASTVQELGITQILTPILATPILLRRWQQTSAQYLTTHVGTTVAVFNSLALGQFHPGTQRGAYTMLVMKPDHVRRAATTASHRNPEARLMSPADDALTIRSERIAVY